MMEADRHGAANLFIICGPCHDIIDDKNNEATYPALLLRQHKKRHEDRFKKAERQFIEQFVDETQLNQPVCPKTLAAYAAACGITDTETIEREKEGFGLFIDRLKELPLTERQFAIKVAERMHRQGAEELDVYDTKSAFNIGAIKLKRHMDIIAHHSLGDISERPGHNRYVVVLSEQWLSVLFFCKKTHTAPEEILQDLNFGLLD